MKTTTRKDSVETPPQLTQADPAAQIQRIVPRLNARGQTIGQSIVLTDSREVPVRDKPKARPKKTGPAAEYALPAIVRAQFLIQCPDAYALFPNLVLGTDPLTGGGPATYPRQLWSLLYALQVAIATQRGLLQWVRIRIILREIIKMIASLRDDASPEDQIIIDRWLRSKKKIPSEGHLSRMFRSLKDRGWDAQAELTKQGIALVEELGRFTSEGSASDMTNAIIGDGTVLKAACKATDEETMDLDGTITKRRVDTFSTTHTEAGNEQVYGSKGVAIWSPSPHRHGTVCLGFAWETKKNPQSEAKKALEITAAAHKLMSNRGMVPSNFAYDRAAGHIQQDELNAMGMFLTTRAIGDTLEKGSESHYLKPKFIGTHTPGDGCECTYHLFAIQKQLHLQIITDTGEDQYLPLKHVFRSQVTKGRRYNYTDHTIPCRTHRGAEHKVSIPWNGAKSFTAKGKNRLDPVDKDQYQQILAYLQPHAPGSEPFIEAFGIRQRTETMHSIIDALLPFKILQRWDEAGKSGFIYGFLMGHNILVRLAQLGGIGELLHPDA